MNKRTLDNGLEIVEINKHETKFLYNEIFEENTYRKPEFTIDPAGVVLDIGANIGLFALYMTEWVEGVKIKCFEPSPACAQAVRENTIHLGGQVEVLEIAAGDENTECEFFHYPGYTIMSSLLANDEEDRATLISGTKAQAEKRGLKMSDRELELLTDTILGKRETYQCTMRRLSDVIREHDIERISLLKIDVEKAELMVLSGLENGHLQIIDNIIVEVHDLGNDEHNKVRTRLEDNGFEVNMVAEGHLENSKIYTVWGWRK
jgi:FkbM family methyltransferase